MLPTYTILYEFLASHPNRMFPRLLSFPNHLILHMATTGDHFSVARLRCLVVADVTTVRQHQITLDNVLTDSLNIVTK